MQFRKIVVQREIEAAAVALGLPRRVSPRRVERECFALQKRLNETKTMFKPGKEYDRFLALANLFLLMDLAGGLESTIEALQSDLVKRSKHVRELAAKAAA
jgi:hypothetical protein